MPKSPPPYPAEFRRRMVELVRSGKTPTELSRQFEPSAQAITNWVRQSGILVKAYIRVAVLLSVAVCLNGCPARYQIELLNETESAVAVLKPHSGTIEANIGPGERKIVEFPASCLVLQTSSRRFQYPRTIPSDPNCVEVRTFSVLVAATFTADQKLRIRRRAEMSDGATEVEEGCTIPPNR
jgi:hypothetical protein